MTEPRLQDDPFGLESVAVLASLDAAARDEIRRSATLVRLPAGGTLFREGEPGEAMFVILRGSLQVVIGHDTAAERTVDILDRGALVGEMALLLGEPRSATIVARRDSELLRLDRPSFDGLLSRHPRAATELARLLGGRLRRTTRRTSPASRSRAVALVAADDGARAALPRLAAAFEQLTRSVVLLGASDAARYDPDDWESRFRYVLLEVGRAPGEWPASCLRQADAIVVLATADGVPFGERDREAWPADCRRRPTELVLLSERDREVRAAPWLDAGHYRRHHLVRGSRDEDYQRVVRRLTGRAVGVVLSGGGARGFAHIGVIRAIVESGVPIDFIGGSSMGAIIAAEYALGLDPDAMVAATRSTYVARQPFDMTLPIVSLTSAAGTVKRLKRLFGDARIEDLAVPYLCAATDLSRAETVVYDRGPLWLATRVSCAIPGFAPPVTSGGSLLVDGGLLNNLPADVMRDRCDGAVIGVNVTPGVDLTTAREWPTQMSGWRHAWERLTGARSPHPSILEILSRAALVGSMRDSARMAAHCDLYIAPDVGRFGMSDFTAIDALVAAGREAALDALPAWIRSREHGEPVAAS